MNVKLDYFEDIVRSRFSNDFQDSINFTINENNLVIIEVKHESKTVPSTMLKIIIHEKIVDGLFPYGMKVNEDYKIDTKITWKPTKPIQL